MVKRTITCPHCASDQVQRRIGRIRIARSEESRLDDLADPGNLEGLENDPRAMGQMMRKMGREMGEDLGPEFDEVVGRLEAGQSPEDIEQALPDLGEDAGGLAVWTTWIKYPAPTLLFSGTSSQPGA